MTNTPVDWKVFEYKFSQDPRSAFENLANILFCYEMEQPHGVFRYFNQPYIETSTVTAPDGLVTGFQAKYYDAGTSFSSKEAELKDAIRGAKKKYAGINRIIFYVNKEMSASTHKDTEKPAYQRNIEECGKDLGITIEWRVPGNIEHMLLNMPNVRDLYFNPQPGLTRYMEAIRMRGESILTNIQSEILYQGQTIKVHHDTQVLHEFLNSDRGACIVYGEAGTGKSGVIKDLISEKQAQDGTLNFFMFATTDLDVEEDVLFLRKYGEYQVEDAFSLYSKDELKICVIESAEKFFTLNHPQVFESIVHKFIAHSWKVIFTIRTAYKDGFCSLLLNGIPYTELQIDRISAELLANLSEQHDFQMPRDEGLKDLLQDLFYLKLYLKLTPSSLDTLSSAKLFMEQVWRVVIRNDAYRAHNLPVRREQMARNIIFSMLQRETSIYRSGADDDYEALQALEESGVIAVYDGSSDCWMMSHDVYEEIVVKRILTDRYQQHISAEELREGFGTSLRARKLYRIWLEELLAQDEKELANFLMSVLQSPIEQSWQDETLIALMQSGNGEAFKILDLVMSQEQYKLLARATFLLNTACRVIDRELIRKLPELAVIQYRFTRPAGSAWHTIFKFIYNNRTLIPWGTQTLDIVVNTLNTWTYTHKTGETTQLAGKIACYLKNVLWKNEEYPYTLQRDERFIRLNDIILASAMELQQELSKIFNNTISVGTCDDYNENFLLIKKSLSSIFNCGKVCQAIPLEMIRLLEIYWWTSPKKKHRYDFSSADMESYFGLDNSIHNEYHPSSAFQTPLYPLLCVKPVETLNLILRLLNYATDCYGTSELERDYQEIFEIEIKLSSEETVKQACSDRLWKMYRGTSVAPGLLESALMALEKWLLEMVENTKPETANWYCKYLLRNSRTAAITAVVLSAVAAYPNKLFEISCILLKTKEIFVSDVSRLQQERSANLFKGRIASHKLYDDERIESNNLAFRKVQFECVLIDYQLKPGNLSEDEQKKRLERLYAAFDEATVGIDFWEPALQYAYYRADLRKRQIREGKTEEGESFIALEPHMPEKLIDVSRANEIARQQLFQHTPLLLWAEARLNHDQKAAKTYPQFEVGLVSVLEEVKQILEEEGEFLYFNTAAAINACCVLLADEKEQMSGDQAALCADVVIAACLPLAMGKGTYQAGAGFDAAIPALAGLASSNNLSVEWTNPLFLLFALVMDGGKEREIALKSIANVLWKSDKIAAQKLLFAYAKIAPQYLKEVHRGISPEQFFANNAVEIENLFQEEVHELDTISVDDLTISQLIGLQRMIDFRDETLFNMTLKIGNRIWETIFKRYSKDKESRRDYEAEYGYMQWLGGYVLNLSEEQQSILLDRLMRKVTYDQEFGDFLKCVICAESTESRYGAFWSFWNLLRNYIFSECEKNGGDGSTLNSDLSIDYGLGCVLTIYLLAISDAKSWCSLREEASIFYREAAKRIGNSVTLYAISRVLNTLGTEIFFNNGVEWLSDITENHPELQEVPLPVNTLYYVEEYMCRYVKKQIYTFKSDLQRRQKVLNILNFLVNRGSSLGFMLREEII